MKVFTESIISEMKTTNENKTSGVLCTLVGPCMEFGSTPNRNNRIYSRKLVEDRILYNPTVQECIKNRSMLGEGGHPENRIDISYPQVGIACKRLWIKDGNDHLLYGEFDVLDTPTGRILNTLAQYGTKLGISARAVADSIQKDGHEVILENSYELITFDAVTEPGFKCARLEKADPISKPLEKMTTSELKESSAALKSFKNPVFESRIRILDNEICKREHRININEITESVNRLSNSLDASLKKFNRIKYEERLSSLIKDAKQLINEAKYHKVKALNSKIVNESSSKVQRKSNSVSIKYNDSDDLSINKFKDDSKFNESLRTENIFNKDTSALERMCSHFRRNSYE